MSIERTVEQAYDSAKGRAVAHLDRETMDDLGVEDGDTVEIVGEDRAVVTVRPARDDDTATGVVRVDGFTRQHAGVVPGETVTVEPVAAGNAEAVTLQPAAAQCCPIEASHAGRVHNDLLGTPTRTGSRVWVMVGPQQPFGVVLGSWRPLEVVATDPEGPVVVTRSTDVTVESAIDDVEAGSTAADVESWEQLREAAFERDGRACRNCGVDFDTGSVSLEAHFVVPPVHGGTVGVDNLVTLCRQCHATAHESVTTPSV